MLSSYNLEETIFSMILFVEKTDVSKLKEYKLDQLMNILKDTKEDDLDTYDEYYEDVDEMIAESDRNFYVDLYSNYDDRFTCNGILDDDDLADFDELIGIKSDGAI